MGARPWAALAAALSCAVAACRKEPGHDGSPAAPHPSSGARRVGVKVPLPDGWAAKAISDDVLAAGPPGRTVLRIEIRPGGGAAFAPADELVSRFRASVKRASVEVVDAKTQDSTSLAVLRLEERRDAGVDLALLGLKRVGGNLFLCSTAPGSSEDEVKAAAAACGALAYADAAR